MRLSLLLLLCAGGVSARYFCLHLFGYHCVWCPTPWCFGEKSYWTHWGCRHHCHGHHPWKTTTARVATTTPFHSSTTQSTSTTTSTRPSTSPAVSTTTTRHEHTTTTRQQKTTTTTAQTTETATQFESTTGQPVTSDRTTSLATTSTELSTTAEAAPTTRPATTESSESTTAVPHYTTEPTDHTSTTDQAYSSTQSSTTDETTVEPTTSERTTSELPESSSTSENGRSTSDPTTTAPAPESWDRLSKFLATVIDPDADPCDDFFDFVCGNSDDDVEYQYFRQLERSGFETAASNLLSDKQFPEKLRQFVPWIKQCASQGSQEPFAEFVLQFGDLSILSDTSTNVSSLSSLVQKISHLGVNVFYGVETVPNVNCGNTGYALRLLQPSLLFGLAPEVWRNGSSEHTWYERAHSEVQKMALTAAQVRGVTVSQEKASAFADRILRVAKDIAAIENDATVSIKYQEYLPYPRSRYDKMKILNITNLLKDYEVSLDSIGCILMAQPQYFRKLESLLQTYDINDLKDYALVKLAFATISLNGDQFAHMTNRIDNNFTHLLDCVKMFHRGYPFAVGRFFDDDKSGDPFADIHTRMRGAMLYEMGHFYVNQQTRVNMAKKFASIQAFLNRPEAYTNDTQFDEELSGLDLSKASDYVGAYFLAQSYHHSKEMAMLKEGYGRQPDAFSPLDFGPSYRYATNSYVLPNSMLDFPFFFSNFPYYVNLATAGAALGYSFAQAYDSNGIRFGDNGQLETIYDAESRQLLQSRLDCLAEQFSQVRDDTSGSKLNGTLQADSNYATSLGLKTAYHAYKVFLEEGNSERRLPGYPEFAPTQQFFINYGKNFCGRSGYDQQGHHRSSTPRWRLNGALRNFKPFATEFGCKPGSRLAAPACDLF